MTAHPGTCNLGGLIALLCVLLYILILAIKIARIVGFCRSAEIYIHSLDGARMRPLQMSKVMFYAGEYLC